MSRPKILILNTQESLTDLTINSIKKNSPEWSYNVVDCEPNKRVKTALLNTHDITLVATSGMYLNLKDNSVPPLDKIEKYHMLNSRLGVFCDNNLYNTHYEMHDIKMHSGIVDMSVFIITPQMWDFCPEEDSGFYSKIKTQSMPRYMNHRNDPLVELSVSARHAFKYGLSGSTASVLNYVDHYKSGQATVKETYAYAFDKIDDCLDGVSPHYRENIMKLADKTRTRITNFREAMNKFYND